jgi:hypothetical protein
MRASIRRIDLTQQPAQVDVWPSMDWLSGDLDAPSEAPRGPRGRGGLWTAMANAVARARETSEPGPVKDLFDRGEIIDLAVEAPHLAYLARVAAGSEGRVAEDGGYEADVIVFDGYRSDR